MRALRITAHGPAVSGAAGAIGRAVTERARALGARVVALVRDAGARILDPLRPLFESGRLRPHPSRERHPLEDAARAYEQVARGSPSKVVLVPRSGV
jgi:NADPH:quinone reductase-like Zn-dependent oxidoreductase